MKTNYSILSWFSVAFLLLFSISSHAQDKFSFSIKAGLGIPTQDLGNTEIKAGFGYEGVMGYQMTSLLSVYAGWSHQFFAADEQFAGLDLDFEETGYTAGLQFTYPAEVAEVQYAMSVGLLYNHIEAEDPGGEIIADSGHELGAQIEGLVAIPLSQTLYLIPFARYRMLDTDLTIDEVTTPTNLNYISIGTGIKWTF
jgi:hypothetical protein